MPKKKDPIPEEFASYDEAAEFWDTYDTMDYPENWKTVEVVSELKNRIFEVEIDPDLMQALLRHARSTAS